MIDSNAIIGFIEARKDALVALSQRVWDAPELSWSEHQAVEWQIAVAGEAGLRVTRDVAGLPTAFTAEMGSGGPVIAILGEYDALSGLSQAAGVATPQPDPDNPTTHGHGCGQHLLGSASLLAALALADHLRSTGIPGRVRYYGCPAEETVSGKTFMVKGDAFSDVDAAVTWHPASTTGVLQSHSLAVIQSYFHFVGTASHAGNSPHLGRSALDAAELMNVGVNFLREHMAPDTRVHYAITDAGGTSPNVVQATSSVYYTTRAATVADAAALYERVERVAEGAALMTDTTVTVEFDGGCAELLPNEVLERAMDDSFAVLGPVVFDDDDDADARAFQQTFDASEIQTTRTAAGVDPQDAGPLHRGVTAISDGPRPVMGGSTDVGDVSWVVPTVQAVVACAALGTAAHSWQLVAQGKLPAAHKGMVHAAKAMALTAAMLLSDQSLLEEAGAELARATDAQPYISPIPDGVAAPPLR